MIDSAYQASPIIDHRRSYAPVSTIRKTMTRVTRQRAGFSLVELSVVLVVIGLILGAVSIGKDLQRNAEFKKIYGTFVQQWALSYNEFYSRTGLVLGDDLSVGPSLRVNGLNGTSGTPAVTALLCDESPPTTGVTQTLETLMDGVGIEMPPGRAEGREARYVYLDSNGNPMEIRVCFRNIPWYNSDSSGGNTGGKSNNNKNVMVLTGLTPDLARMIDSIVDGRPDARFGSFRGAAEGWASATSFAAPGGVAGVRWIATNITAGGLDEEQVTTVTAYYRMNQ
jgi:prepilin-type N-terminal cleavage/methylation domain-containing protein